MAAEVYTPGGDAVVADAGEAMDATAAAVVVAPQGAGRESAGVVTVAALGRRAEVCHHRLPLGAVGANAMSVQAVGHQVGDLVRQCLREEVGGVSCQQRGVVAHLPSAGGVDSDLPRRSPAEIETDQGLRDVDAEVLGGGRQQGPCALGSETLQRVARVIDSVGCHIAGCVVLRETPLRLKGTGM